MLSCSLLPCEHDGTCVPSGSSYECVCPISYTGAQCENGKNNNNNNNNNNHDT